MAAAWTVRIVGRPDGDVWELVRSDLGLKLGGELGYVLRCRRGFELFRRPDGMSIGIHETLEGAARAAVRDLAGAPPSG